MEKPRLRLSMDPKERWPDKLYDVANDGYLLKWNPTGNSVIVEEAGFADKVMHCYPGFVQIPLFLNLRRLFREYGFDWKIVDDGNTFEFSHPCLVRGQRQMLDEIRTRRKSFSKLEEGTDIFKPPFLTASPSKKYCTRSSVKPKQDCATRKPEEVNDKAGCKFTSTERLQHGSTAQHKTNDNARVPIDSEIETCSRPTNLTIADVMVHYAVHEMNLDEFASWAETFPLNYFDYAYGHFVYDINNINLNRPIDLDQSQNQDMQVSSIQGEGLGLCEEVACGRCKCCQIHKYRSQQHFG